MISLIKRIRDVEQDTNDAMRTFEEQREAKKRTKRRDWFSLVGRGFHKLFSTLDEDVEDNIRKQVKSTNNRTSLLADLAGSQTKIIQSKLAAMEKKSKKLEKFVGNLRKSIIEQDTRIDILFGIEEIEISLLQYEINAQTIEQDMLMASKVTLHRRFFNTLRD